MKKEVTERYIFPKKEWQLCENKNEFILKKLNWKEDVRN